MLNDKKEIRNHVLNLRQKSFMLLLLMQKQKQFSFILSAEKAGLKPAELRFFLTILCQEGPIENNLLLQKTGLAKSILKDIKRELSFMLEKPSAKTVLNPRGKELVNNFLATPLPSLDKAIQEITQLFKKYQSQRPPTKRNLDQFRASDETVIKRVKLMAEQGDLDGRDILFLGDSDFISLGVALTGQPGSLQVLELDEDVLNLVKLVSKREKLGISSFKYDAREPLPFSLLNRFDVVFTDPPYTLNGFQLFLSRSIQALKKRNTSTIYISYGHSRRSNERELKIQEALVKAGLLIHLKLPNFNQYLMAGSIGSSSSIYICEYTPLAKPLISGKFSDIIYTGQSKSRR